MSQLPMLSALEIAAERLVLRKAHEADRDGLIELLTDAEIRAYLGGPRLRSAVEQHFDAVGAASATSEPGTYVIADSTMNQLTGTLVLARRPAGRPGHLTEGGEELELSYVLRRSAWGMGLAFEAAAAAFARRSRRTCRPTSRGRDPDSQSPVAEARHPPRLPPRRHVEEFGAEHALATARLHTFKA